MSRYLERNLAGHGDGAGLNSYYYVAGREGTSAQTSAPARVRVLDRGPLVASLVVESTAPGCRQLQRHVRVVDGQSRVDVLNIIDKLPVRTPESVHFAFSPSVPDGVMRMDVPWAVVRPDEDQLPGSCKNYFTVGRWVDVSNSEVGLTWATVDAPLVEIGAITVDVPRPIGTPTSWIRQLEPTQTFYSYVMNNYWETNYKASQEGPTHFRYALAPHGRFDAAAAARFGTELSCPLMVVPTAPESPVRGSMLSVEPAGVLATSLVPSRDGQALVLRLYNAGDQRADATVTWHDPVPRQVVLSNPYQQRGEPVAGPLSLPPKAIVTLRAELGPSTSEQH